MPVSSIAIIGAGIAGLSAATHLSSHGHRVVMFEKARGPGGRLSSRRTPEGPIDIGAQYFTARDPRFMRELVAWQSAGVVAPWGDKLLCRYQGENEDSTEEDGWRPLKDQSSRFVASPRMSALSRHLSERLPTSVSLHTATRITRLVPSDPLSQQARWQLQDDSGKTHGPFSHLVISAPAPQALALLASAGTDAAGRALSSDSLAPQLSRALAEVEMAPTWTLMAALDVSLPVLGDDVDWQGLLVSRGDDGPLRCVMRQHSRPGRDIQGQAQETLSLLATAGWSQSHLEDSPEQVAKQLWQAFEALPGIRALPKDWSTDKVRLTAHRWRYAHPTRCSTQLAAQPALQQQGLVLAGDALRGPRVEDAWLSGHEAAEQLINSLAGSR